MKQKYFLLLFLLLGLSGWMQGQLQPFKDDVESQGDFQQNNLVGWTSLDLDGLNTSGPFQSYPGKGGPLGFIVYNPSKTTPVNTLPGYEPKSGQKYFASISSNSGPSNDWLISAELAAHTGGTFSFYAKSAATFAGFDKFKIAYSTTGANPADFIFINSTPKNTTANWAKYEYVIPAGAKHVAINCVSTAFMMLVDDIEFAVNTVSTAPNTITDFSSQTQTSPSFQAIFNWINPTVDIAGNALSTMTGVKIYRGTNPMNLTEIADLTSGPGQTMTYSDALPGTGTYSHRFVPYNNSGNGKAYNTPLTFFGYETIPGAPRNITFTRNASQQNIIAWDAVDYGAEGGVLQNPVVGYKILRTLGNTTEVLANMHPATTFTETPIPAFNLYTYSIIAQTGPTELGVPATVTAYSGMNSNQTSVTSGKVASEQPFQLDRESIISQSIYTPAEIGGTGLITSLSYFGNLGTASTSRYKIYMSVTNRNVFGTTPNNAVWEYYGNQKLLFDGEISFPAGVKALTLQLDQPFYYNASNNQNVIITIVKPLISTVPSVNPRDFFNTPVEGMRTYYAVGYSADLSIISTQPPAWATEEIITIPSIVVEKNTSFSTLSGKVTSAANGLPVAGVTVTVTPNDSASYQTETAVTDASGNYYIPALIAGNYVAKFSKNTFNTLETNFSVAQNQQLTLDVVIDNAVPIQISGNVRDLAGNGIGGINLTLTGFSEFTTVSDAAGNFTLDAFGLKEYELKVTHPLYISKTFTFTSEASNQTLSPITLELALHKPGNISAINNNGVGEVAWRKPVGYYNETMLGWGSFITTGDAWGNGGNPFIAGIRFETSDLQAKVTPSSELTHVRVHFANNANAVIRIYEGQNGGNLIHSQPVAVTERGWYVFELTKSLPIDVTKELWIGIEFLAGQYGSYPIGLDDGPNAPGKKGSMKYENGAWAGMSLTNKNWNIYGIANNLMDAVPTGYKLYRTVAAEANWTELTPDPITVTNFSDTTLSSAAPGLYKYGITALYGDNLVSEKGISNEIENKLLFDFILNITPDFGSSAGAYVSVSNDTQFYEAFMPAGNSLTFNDLMRGTYNMRIELDNYEIVELSGIIVEENRIVSVPLNLLKVRPSNLKATIENPGSARLDWSLHNTYTDKIEKYQDFERQNIGNYIMKDLDGLQTYTYTNFTWPGAGNPMAFMVFNPYSTTPPVTEIDALSGRRFLSAFAGPVGANNDWFIIPAGSGQFSLNAASLTNSMLEKMRVLYSVTGTEVSDFIPFESQITVPTNWTKYSFEAPAETKYVAINFVSNDSYILKIDDLTYERKYDHALSYNVYLDGTLVSGNVAETSFVLENLSPGTHIAEVEAVYETGLSEKSQVTISVLNVENSKKPGFAIYPNPSKGKFWVELDSKATVSLFDMSGKLLYTGVKEAGKSVMEHYFPAGTYIIQVQTEKGVTTKKIIFL